ncbi:hypothetical protein ACJJTC_019100 [Scirpophaga incertulas]
MDRLQLERKIARRRFSISANKFEEYLTKKEMSNICAEHKKLSMHHDNLVVVQNKYFNCWLESESREEQLVEKESDDADEFESRWYHLEENVKEMMDLSECAVNKSRKSVEDESLGLVLGSLHQRCAKKIYHGSSICTLSHTTSNVSTMCQCALRRASFGLCIVRRIADAFLLFLLSVGHAAIVLS